MRRPLSRGRERPGWTGPIGRRIVAPVKADRTCAMCGNPIKVGEAWMEAEREGENLRVHAGCLYGDEQRAAAGDWEPQDHAAV